MPQKKESETKTGKHGTEKEKTKVPRQSTLQIPDVGKTPAWRSLWHRQTQNPKTPKPQNPKIMEDLKYFD